MINLYKSFYALKLKEDPIFIGGCGRSGTSLLLSILSAHPHIYGISDETNIYGYPRRFKSPFLNKINNYRKLLPYLVKDDKIFLATRWCEKTPRNIRYFGTINKELRGEVKFIHISRDGRDVVTSIHPLTGKYHVSPKRWVNDVSKGLLLSHLPNLLEIKYEDLILNYEKTIRDILLFLEEDFCENMYNFQQFTNVKSHKAFKNETVSEINSSSINKWKDKKHSKRIEMFYNSPGTIELLEKLNYTINL